MNFFIKFLIFVFLTILTQIGGVVFLLEETLTSLINPNFKFKKILVFLILYLIATFLFVPNIAPYFGREKIKNSSRIYATNYFTVLLNRNYVNPKLNKVLERTEIALKNANVDICYLDANFPFINNYPLLPHLSHNDGKKIDLSLVYENSEGEIINKQKSISGYGVFEKPKRNEINQIKSCLKKGYSQYDYSKYLTFGTINSDLVFSTSGTQKLINSLLLNQEIEKIFIEPHLKNRLKLTNQKIRYHGCHAVRHDDHIHVQIQ